MRYYEIVLYSRHLGYVRALSTFGALLNWIAYHPEHKDSAIEAYEAL